MAPPGPARGRQVGLDNRIVRIAPLALIMLVALALRGWLAMRMTVYHADEVWQYLEPAYGLVTGRWVRAWEYRDGLRGWFVPVLLTPPLALGQWLAPGTQAHIWLMRWALGLASLAVPLAWHDLARPLDRRADGGSALIAALVGATWCEVFYFGVRSSAEGLALTLVFPAMALARRVNADGDRRIALGFGLLAGAALLVRYHYLPMVGPLALWALARNPRRLILPVAGGVALALVIGGLADALCGDVPLLWIWRSFRFNLLEGRSDQFGVEPPLWIVRKQVAIWGMGTWAIIPAALIGARRYPVIALGAVAIIALHSAIPHKEIRFTLLAGTSLVLLAAIGSAQACAWATRRLGHDGPARAATLLAFVVLAGGWLAASRAAATGPDFVENWVQGDKLFTPQVMAGQIPGICGLATYQAHSHPLLSAAFINRPVPLLLFDGPQASAQAAALHDRFNVALGPRIRGMGLPADFRRVVCYREEANPPEDQMSCLFVRPGGCRGDAGDFAYQAAMERRGK